MGETIKKILELAVYAPSGDNMQPWKFSIHNETLYIYNVPEKDPTLYNFKQRASLISQGALIENISIIAPKYGYKAIFDYVPKNSHPNLVAKVSMLRDEKFEHPLFSFIKKRHTNRKPYKKIGLTDEQKNLLVNIFQNTTAVSVHLVENYDDMKKAAAAVCQVDRMIFENKTIHDFLFGHIRWTEEEEIKSKNGLYLKSMELAPPQVAAFKLFKSWGTMRMFNALGFPKIAVKTNLTLYTNSSAFAALLVPDFSPYTCLELGRLLQRFWLMATSVNLSLHPMSGVPFLMQRVEENHFEHLESYQVELIKKSYAILAKICQVKEKKIGFFFRIGEALPPSGLSSRLAPEIEIQT